MLDGAVEAAKALAIEAKDGLNHFTSCLALIGAVALNALDPGLRENRDIEIHGRLGLAFEHQKGGYDLHKASGRQVIQARLLVWLIRDSDRASSAGPDDGWRS